jgi:hypothetical protein
LEFFPDFFPFLSISLENPTNKHLSYNAKIPPSPKKPLFVVMMFSCKLKLWLEVFSLTISLIIWLVTTFLVEFQCDFIIILVSFQRFVLKRWRERHFILGCWA